MLEEAYGGIVGGNYGGNSTSRKILKDGLWRLTVYSNATNYDKICNVCQRTRKTSWRDELSLVPQVTVHPLISGKSVSWDLSIPLGKE